MERFQGSQRDYIIYGFTIQKYYQLNFLTSNVFEDFDGSIVDRKLNVAMTRARSVLTLSYAQMQHEYGRMTTQSPSQFIDELSNAELAEVAEADDKLADKLKEYQKDGYLILLMTAGPADKWYRKIFN